MLVLDTGNLLYDNFIQSEAEAYSVKNDIITESLNQMKYNGVNLGPTDIFPDISFLEERVKNSNFPIISANTKIFEVHIADSIQKYIIKEINGIRIGITGVMPIIEENFNIQKLYHIENPEKALKSIIPELAEKTDFIILLSQLKSEGTMSLLNSFPEIDLGLFVDHTIPQLPINKNQSIAKKPAAMTITIKGMEIGILNIEKDGDNVKIIDAERIRLDQKVKSDQKTIELTDKFNTWTFLKEQEQKRKVEEAKKKKEINHQKLLKKLELTPEDFFKQHNKGTKK